MDSLFVLLIIKDSLLVTFDEDLETGIDQLLGCGGRDGRPTLKLLLFAAQPETLWRHDEQGSAVWL